MSYKEQFAVYSDLINKKLDTLFLDRDSEFAELTEAMAYSLCCGGKRVRPSLMLEFNRVCGGNVDSTIGFAIALEMIHTYSLIHDDLPCMDDDNMRRGKPSCHIAFGESTALLAGDGLLTDAFSVALSTENVSPKLLCRAGLELSKLAGTAGMIGGQVIDLKYEDKHTDVDSVLKMYSLKTGALLKAAARSGCILADADEKTIQIAGEYAENIGVAFQIIDDVLDIIGSEEELGKPIGSDADSDKSTYVSFVGIENAIAKAKELTEYAINKLCETNIKDIDNLKEFAISLLERKN